MTTTLGLSQNSIIAYTILTQELDTQEISVVNNQFNDNTCEDVPTNNNQNINYNRSSTQREGVIVTDVSTGRELVIGTIQVNTQNMLPLCFKDNKEF